jgi:hypothetical protein
VGLKPLKSLNLTIGYSNNKNKNKNKNNKVKSKPLELWRSRRKEDKGYIMTLPTLLPDAIYCYLLASKGTRKLY